MKRIDDVWDACPEGEIARLAAALRRTHWTLLLTRTAGVIAVGLVIFTLVFAGATLLR